MATRYFGERIKRNEDPRLLMGRALFVDDVDLPNMLHVAFVRSPYAHARINAIDVSPALQRVASSPRIRRTTSARIGSRGRCSCRRRPSKTSPSISARKRRSPKKLCGMSASQL